MPPRRSPLRRIQALAVHQPGVGAQGQELLGGGGVAVHRCQHQGGSALVVAGVHRRSLADEAFYLLGVARTGSVPHVAWQRCPEAFLHGGGGGGTPGGGWGGGGGVGGLCFGGGGGRGRGGRGPQPWQVLESVPGLVLARSWLRVARGSVRAQAKVPWWTWGPR